MEAEPPKNIPRRSLGTSKKAGLLSKADKKPCLRRPCRGQTFNPLSPKGYGATKKFDKQIL
ncbi:hypothetical protein MSL71_18660 [Desulfoluna butyratoxydans]|uniref:Uncharacterized protein n=1 Tax=Desulfoluna butyratoxydans TaxID=231438 RepID=A0A4U8YKP6_9BACT|nr:hypothetical protein MSL71_18660 [Desulfoluna butyratoxydans]